MKFLIDGSPQCLAKKKSDLILGQLITPLTGYSDAGLPYAIDNGAFSEFREDRFVALLNRQKEQIDRCIFVAVPDIVGNARRTLELFQYRRKWVSEQWPVALVCQDGCEDITIPWDDIHAVFIGGRDPWKDSQAAVDIAKTARVLGKWVHVGRVNTNKRFNLFCEIADSCDGSGVARYDHMLKSIERCQSAPTLFDKTDSANDR